MREERLQHIIKQLEEEPDMPLFLPIDHEAIEAICPVRAVFPKAKLVMMLGIRCIAITDKALEFILDRLIRERSQFVRKVEIYDQEIAGVRSLIGNDNKCFYSPESLISPPRQTDPNRQ